MKKPTENGCQGFGIMRDLELERFIEHLSILRCCKVMYPHVYSQNIYERLQKDPSVSSLNIDTVYIL